MSEASSSFESHDLSTREPIKLALLAGLTVVFFLFVTGLSRLYLAQQESLANRWSARGDADLNARRYSAAVDEFRTALLYSRDNPTYQLNLAEALLAEKKDDEAYVYLSSLWDRQPENGLVNLELARIAAARGQNDKALRYYHDAIYAIWPDTQEKQRQQARLELIEMFLRNHEQAQAQSELIALAANLADDPAQQAHVGNLFLQAQDDQHALAEFQLSLNADPHNQVALAGAGQAAFDLGNYSLAQQYLQEEVAAVPGDAASAKRLAIANLVIASDPFRQHIKTAERNQIVVNAFAAAGVRLESCRARNLTPAAAQQNQALDQSWTQLNPQITESDLRRNPDLVDTAMEQVFNIERQTSATCGPASGTDMALLLIAKMHEGL